jgi:hypothetical protein
VFTLGPGKYDVCGEFRFTKRTLGRFSTSTDLIPGRVEWERNQLLLPDRFVIACVICFEEAHVVLPQVGAVQIEKIKETLAVMFPEKGMLSDDELSSTPGSDALTPSRPRSRRLFK